MKTKIIVSFMLLLSLGAAAQTSRGEMYRDLRRTGSAYFAYPGPSQKALTPAPEGYEPVYISHYSRHGSRYMTDNKYYVQAIEMLDSAARMGILTPTGAQVLEKIQMGYADALSRDGDLTKLGGQQHREIAHRMYERFPSLLSQPLKVDARSSTVGRCMISMFYFTQELQGLNPALVIRMDASKRDMPFVVGDEDVEVPAGEQADALKARITAMQNKAHNPSRIMKVLFKDVKKADDFVDGVKLMKALHNIAQDMQNVPELGIDLYGVFTKEELFAIWKGNNAGWLRHSGLLPGSTPRFLEQKPVLDSLVAAADRAVLSGEPSLSLRFSHDSSVLPLAYLMGLKETQGCTGPLESLYKKVSIDKIIPMAANIQVIFYRKDGSDDILVKFLLNENETTIPVKTAVSPYYNWEDVKAYWKAK